MMRSTSQSKAYFSTIIYVRKYSCKIHLCTNLFSSQDQHSNACIKIDIIHSIIRQAKSINSELIVFVTFIQAQIGSDKIFSVVEFLVK